MDPACRLLLAQLPQYQRAVARMLLETPRPRMLAWPRRHGFVTPERALRRP